MVSPSSNLFIIPLCLNLHPHLPSCSVKWTVSLRPAPTTYSPLFQSSSHRCGLFKDPALAAIPSSSCLTHFPLSAWPRSPMYKHQKPFLDPTTTHFSLPFCSKISPKSHLYLISPLLFYCPFFPQSAGTFWIGACNKGIKHTKWYLAKGRQSPFPSPNNPVSFPRGNW